MASRLRTSFRLLLDQLRHPEAYPTATVLETENTFCEELDKLERRVTKLETISRLKKPRPSKK